VQHSSNQWEVSILVKIVNWICTQYVLSRAVSDVNLSQTPKLGMQMISEHSIHGINCLQSCRMEQRCCSGWELLSVLLLLESFVTPLSSMFLIPYQIGNNSDCSGSIHLWLLSIQWVFCMFHLVLWMCNCRLLAHFRV